MTEKPIILVASVFFISLLSLLGGIYITSTNTSIKGLCFNQIDFDYTNNPNNVSIELPSGFQDRVYKHQVIYAYNTVEQCKNVMDSCRSFIPANFTCVKKGNTCSCIQGDFTV